MERQVYTAKSTRSAGTYISSNQLGIILGSLSNNIKSHHTYIICNVLHLIHKIARYITFYSLKLRG